MSLPGSPDTIYTFLTIQAHSRPSDWVHANAFHIEGRKKEDFDFKRLYIPSFQISLSLRASGDLDFLGEAVWSHLCFA